MIARVLEPEAMDGPDEVQQYDAMDHSAVNAQFTADFLAVHGLARGGEYLDVGTGTARIPITLAEADPQASILALDLAQAMLEQAAINIARAGLSHRIRCHLGDVRLLLEEFGPGSFEGVISNTIVHHLAEPAPALEVMCRLVAPGGTLFVRDLVRPGSVAEIKRLTARYCGQETAEAQALFAASLHAALTLDEIRTLVAALGLPDTQVVMTSDRHWTWIWRKPDSDRPVTTSGRTQA
jgi:ubiquinone/menaquinone biosynthesis C-methylase UbiE